MTVLFVLAIFVIWIISGIFAYWLVYRAGDVDDPEDDFVLCVGLGCVSLLIVLICLALEKIRNFVESL